MFGFVNSAQTLLGEALTNLEGLDTGAMCDVDVSATEQALGFITSACRLLDKVPDQELTMVQTPIREQMQTLSEPNTWRRRPVGVQTEVTGYSGPPDETTVLGALGLPMGTKHEHALAKIRELRQFKGNVEAMLKELCHNFRTNTQPEDDYAGNIGRLKGVATAANENTDWIFGLIRAMGKGTEDDGTMVTMDAAKATISDFIDEQFEANEFVAKARESFPLVRKEELDPKELDRRIFQCIKWVGYVLPFLEGIVKEHFPNKYANKVLFDDQVATWIRRGVTGASEVDSFLNEAMQFGCKSLTEALDLISKGSPLKVVLEKRRSGDGQVVETNVLPGEFEKLGIDVDGNLRDSSYNLLMTQGGTDTGDRWVFPAPHGGTEIFDTIKIVPKAKLEERPRVSSLVNDEDDETDDEDEEEWED